MGEWLEIQWKEKRVRWTGYWCAEFLLVRVSADSTVMNNTHIHHATAPRDNVLIQVLGAF